MDECPNVEMRDLLPDLLNDAVTATERAAVTAHLAECAICREDLELMRNLRAVLRARFTPADFAYLMGALPRPRVRSVTTDVVARRKWADWRIAAAIALVTVGGSSVALLSRDGGTTARTDSVPLVAAANDTPPSIGGLAQVAASASAALASEPVLGMSGHLADLDDEALKGLIGEIEEMKAVPITEPEPVTLKVDPKGQSSQSEGS